MKKIVLVIGLVTLLVASWGSKAKAQFFDFYVSLFDLGGNVYRYEFQLINVGLSRDAIFKWTLDNNRVGLYWDTYGPGFEVPTGWTGVHEDHRLDFQTDNGSIESSNPGLYRLYGQPGAPAPGFTQGLFKWTFQDNDADLDPTLGQFLPYSDPLNVKVHFQPIGDQWQNIGDTYVGTYVPEPESLLLLGSGLLGLGGLRYFRRRK